MRPRRKRLVQASKITDWLRDSPSQSNAEPPSQSPTVCVPADPKPHVEEKKKTRRRRRKAKKTMEEEEVPSVPRTMVSTSAVGETSNGNLIVEGDRSTQHNSALRAESAAVVDLCGLGATSVSGSGSQEMLSKQGCADF